MLIYVLKIYLLYMYKLASLFPKADQNMDTIFQVGFVYVESLRESDRGVLIVNCFSSCS